MAVAAEQKTDKLYGQAPKETTQFQQIVRRFLRNKAAVVGLIPCCSCIWWRFLRRTWPASPWTR